MSNDRSVREMLPSRRTILGSGLFVAAVATFTGIAVTDALAQAARGSSPTPLGGGGGSGGVVPPGTPGNCAVGAACGTVPMTHVEEKPKPKRRTPKVCGDTRRGDSGQHCRDRK